MCQKTMDSIPASVIGPPHHHLQLSLRYTLVASGWYGTENWLSSQYFFHFSIIILSLGKIELKNLKLLQTVCLLTQAEATSLSLQWSQAATWLCSLCLQVATGTAWATKCWEPPRLVYSHWYTIFHCIRVSGCEHHIHRSSAKLPRHPLSEKSGRHYKQKPS